MRDFITPTPGVEQLEEALDWAAGGGTSEFTVEDQGDHYEANLPIEMPTGNHMVRFQSESPIDVENIAVKYDGEMLEEGAEEAVEVEDEGETNAPYLDDLDDHIGQAIRYALERYLTGE